jgi:hypothetical protein
MLLLRVAVAIQGGEATTSEAVNFLRAIVKMSRQQISCAHTRLSDVDAAR